SVFYRRQPRASARWGSPILVSHSARLSALKVRGTNSGSPPAPAGYLLPDVKVGWRFWFFLLKNGTGWPRSSPGHAPGAVSRYLLPFNGWRGFVAVPAGHFCSHLQKSIAPGPPPLAFRSCPSGVYLFKLALDLG